MSSPTIDGCGSPALAEVVRQRLAAVGVRREMFTAAFGGKRLEV
jgi:hypothetical protein